MMEMNLKEWLAMWRDYRWPADEEVIRKGLDLIKKHKPHEPSIEYLINWCHPRFRGELEDKLIEMAQQALLESEE